MEQNPLISVIVPVYGVENYLPKCLDSILAQSYSNLEILLVDDGSPDDSGKICDDYAARDSRIRVIHKPNGGLSSARNAGLEMATGDYVAFVDSDDYVEPDMYSSMLEMAIAQNVPLVCAGRFDEDIAGNIVPGLCPVRDEVVTGKELVRRIFHWENLDAAAWDKLYRRELFRGIRYPEGMVSEDMPTTYRLALLAGKAALLSRPLYHYVHRENSITYNLNITEKTFHFARHTARILEDIRQNCPDLLPEAQYLRVRSLAYSLLMLDLVGEEDRKHWQEIYQASRRELKQYSAFIRKSALFTRGEKLKDFMLAWGLYRPFRKVYHFLKHQD